MRAFFVVLFSVTILGLVGAFADFGVVGDAASRPAGAQVLGCNPGVTPASVQAALTPAETCIVGEALTLALSGAIADPVASLEAILSVCGQATIQDVISAFGKVAPSAQVDAGPVLMPQVAAIVREAKRRAMVPTAGPAKP
jgi:hypothetical protein